ncbi:hypothetical protein HJ588_12550 [Flexivirga sp. ID2601S]|uniref:Uncharacterized protein n=1 Tax=Flexivirga aerilata TaxID=1656889 RepID=A0A849AJC5_9MICO|nr:hypothetical protein [Flexivirga aerilata]NNG40093.1 hypothetical protein [Flexivirga aerilata]
MAFGANWSATRTSGCWQSGSTLDGPGTLNYGGRTLDNAIGESRDPYSQSGCGVLGCSCRSSTTPYVWYSTSICLRGGVNYTFTAQTIALTTNTVTQTLTPQILSSTGTVLVNGTTFDSTASSGTVSLSYQPTATGSYTFRYQWSFASLGTSTSDDIAVQAPTVAADGAAC